MGTTAWPAEHQAKLSQNISQLAAAAGEIKANRAGPVAPEAVPEKYRAGGNRLSS